ncbi:MAG: H(+)/Cl(-) exchange transporter ClcA [Verrucomicrobiales bacterium]|nr:H(+)/Cl(-) exchange transporter ClcA [Verrucomicrobiales bacterium]
MGHVQDLADSTAPGRSETRDLTPVRITMEPQSPTPLLRPDHGIQDGCPRSLLRLALLSVVVGAFTGAVATAFRLALAAADSLRTSWMASPGSRAMGPMLATTATIAAAAAIAAWLVRRFAPNAAGSGIPQVEAAVSGGNAPAGASILPVKFFGGILAIGGGFALGREGPSVQMGATLGTLLGSRSALNASDRLALLAAGAGAGLATAFNAPIAGAVFVLEEIVRRYDPRIALAALGASGGAIAVCRPFLGQHPDFTVAPIPFAGSGPGAWFLALGVICGLVGVIYQRLLLTTLRYAMNLTAVPVELRAAAVGIMVASVGWIHPDWIGGGDVLSQRALTAGSVWHALPILLIVRFGLSIVCYGAGTPGGLFAPLLAIGALVGLLFARVCQPWDSDLADPQTAFALVGMAALFMAVVRTPATGLILTTELTGNVTLLLPMLAAGFTAMLVPSLLRCAPIYDALQVRSSTNLPSSAPKAPDAMENRF